MIGLNHDSPMPIKPRPTTSDLLGTQPLLSLQCVFHNHTLFFLGAAPMPAHFTPFEFLKPKARLLAITPYSLIPIYLILLSQTLSSYLTTRQQDLGLLTSQLPTMTPTLNTGPIIVNRFVKF